MGFQGGTDVAILGMGTICLLALQGVRILGARRLFAFDRDDSKLAIAREYGADCCLSTGEPDINRNPGARAGDYGGRK